MIFVTVGTQLAFPRLTEAMDQLATSIDEEIVAQIGAETSARPNLNAQQYMDPVAFDEAFKQARIIVAHAGIGTILSAKRHNKPLVLLPRRHALGEHRNDHQVATARALEGAPGLHIAWETSDLGPLLVNQTLSPAGAELGPKHGALVDGIAKFIAGQ